MTLLSFLTATGSVTGTEHLRAYRDGQDGVAVQVSPSALVLAVCDGCSSAPQAEIGARVASRFLVQEVTRQIALDPAVPARALAERTQRRLLRMLRCLARTLGAPISTQVADCLLFTYLVAAVRADGYAVFGMGDGAYAINGERTVLLPGVGNAPVYAAYALFGDRRALVPTMHHEGLTAELSSLVLATDGAQDLLLPGAAVHALVDSPRLGRNPSLLGKALRVARDTQGLHDDATCAVLRRRPEAA
jgi:serine/threonine protein phosphatase PrpC